jgi:Carboxypeptidase regulatory-like domain
MSLAQQGSLLLTIRFRGDFMNYRRTVPAAALALLLVVLPAAAQSDRGTITGEVMDSSGAFIPKVDLVLSNTGTGVVSRTQSNESGLYTFSNVPIGAYELRITAAGFKSLDRSGLTLNVAQTVRLDLTLEIGAVQESITVTGETSLLKVDTAQVSTTVQAEAIKDLPLSFAGGRSMEAFAYALTPAVEGNNWTSFIAGGAAFSKEVLIDGISATSQEQGHVGETSPPVEAVQEFTIQTSGMSAEYGHTSGGTFNFALKSGTNRPHGSAFYYGRNEALNANTWLNNWNQSQDPNNPLYKRARDRQNLFGFSEGGPVFIPKIYNGKNKTFFFVAFEKYKLSDYQLSQNYTKTVPIPDFLTGDFSKLLTGKVVGQDALGRDVQGGQIFDPTTLRKVNGKWVSDPFAGNIIPANMISGVSKKIVEIYRKSYQPMLPGLLTNNSTNTASNNPWQNQTQLTVKGDHAFSDRNKLSGAYTWSQRPRILADSGGVWEPQDPDGAGGPFAKARYQNVEGHQYHLSDNWTISNSIVNTFSAAYNRMRNPSISKQDGKGWNSYLGLQSSTSATLFPEISFGDSVNGVGITPIGYDSSGYYVAGTYVANDSLVWIRGRHLMKMGVQFWHQEINSHNGTDTLGFGFSNATTGIPGAPWANQVGFGFASFLLGQVNSAGKNVPFDLYGRRNYVETYFQDDIKLTSRLTVNLGLRWEQPQPFHEKYGHWASFNPTITNTAYDVKGALEFLSGAGDSFERNKDWKEFAPRTGAAYRVNDKMVLRGGYGIFYTPIGINYWNGVPYGFAPGYRGTNTITASNNVPRFNWGNGYPDNYVAPTKDPNALQWGMVAINPNSLSQGYTHQYNASFQYQIQPDLIAEATYLGNLGRRLHSGDLNRNQPTRQAYEASIDPTAWIWDAPSAAAAGVPFPYAGFSAYAGMALQPFPHVAATTWGPIYNVGANRGVSRYDSLQLQLTKRTSKGLTGQFSYVYSRARGDVDNNFDETWDGTGGIQDMYNLQQEANGLLSYDQTHIVKGYVQAQLPFGHGHRLLDSSSRWVDALVSGWNLSLLFHYNTGVPLGVYTNVWYPGWDGAVYADWNRSVDLSRKFGSATFNPGVPNSSGNQYFNTSAFANPVNHKLGNGQRLYDALRGFGYSNEDIGIIKYVHFTESVTLQFRGELLNAFNRHQFADPNTSIGNSAFGYVTGLAGGPRNVQVGLRLGW